MSDSDDFSDFQPVCSKRRKLDPVRHIQSEEDIEEFIEKPIEDVKCMIIEEKAKSDKLKWNSKLRKRAQRLVWGKGKYDGYPMAVTTIYELTCRHKSATKHTMSKSQGKRQHFEVKLGTGCPCYIVLREYKVFLDYQCNAPESKKDKSECMSTLKLDDDPRTKIVTKVERMVETHNHPIDAQQESVVTEEERGFIHAVHDGGIFQPAAISAMLEVKEKMGEGVRAVERMTVTNIINARKSGGGWEGDMDELVKLKCEIEQEDRDSFVYLRNDEEFVFIIQTGFMRKVQKLYGNFTVYCDSTHDVTRYSDVSLYILAVRTNCGYQVLLKRYFPSQQKSYVKANLKLTDKMKAPGPNIPVYLIEKSPLLIKRYQSEKNVDKKLNERLLEQGIEHERKVLRRSEDEFYISSGFQDVYHKVDISVPCCSCRNFIMNKCPCRHILFLLDKEEIEWDDLPEQYTNHPFFNKDSGETPESSVIPIELNMPDGELPGDIEYESEEDEEGDLNIPDENLLEAKTLLNRLSSLVKSDVITDADPQVVKEALSGMNDLIKKIYDNAKSRQEEES